MRHAVLLALPLRSAQAATRAAALLWQGTPGQHVPFVNPAGSSAAPWRNLFAGVQADAARSTSSSAAIHQEPQNHHQQQQQQQQQPRLQAPPGLKAASMQEMASLLPFSYEICSYRHRSFESRRMGVLYKQRADDADTTSTPAAAERPPSDSYLEMHYPFSTNPLLRDQYERFESGHIRLGLILEDLDTFAGDVAARHAGPPNPSRGYVTGSVDSISWFSPSMGGGSSSSSSTGSSASSRGVADERSSTTRVGGIGTSSSTSSSGSVGGSGSSIVDSISWLSPSSEESGNGGTNSRGGNDIRSSSGNTTTSSISDASWSRGSGSTSASHSGSGIVNPASDGSGGALALDEDLRVAGQVVWVGSSSMEVQIELSALWRTSQQWAFVGMARFMMVARDLAAGASVVVPALTAPTEHDRLLQALGRERQSERKALREQPGGPLQLATPTQAEVAMLYDLLARHSGNRTEQQRRQQQRQQQQDKHQQMQQKVQQVSHDQSAVPLSHTCLLTASLMHKQDRNTSFRIFGGHLLREAFEAAFVAASLHAGSSDVEALSMADVSFQHPVPIGAILQFEAQVVYTDGPLMRIAVRALKRDPGDPTSRLITNDFSFAFVSRPGHQQSGGSSHTVAPVYPESLDEAAAYLAGYRRHMEEGFAPPSVL